MKKILETGAIAAMTQYVETDGRKLAYRIIGAGEPIIWCNRFRGVMDDWDPAFIDRLAKRYKVIIFDYTGIGLSTGELPVDIAMVANDVKDLAAALQLEKFVIGGWSYGGFVAQAFSVLYPAAISHTVLIGTKPAGKNDHPSEALFFDVALKVNNDLEDEVILFFEPASKKSRKAATASHERIAQRQTDKDIPVPENVWSRYITGGQAFELDEMNVREKLQKLKTPVLVISGDHEIVFPVQNWYALTGKMPNLIMQRTIYSAAALLMALFFTQEVIAQKPSTELLTPANHALVLIDHESQMAFPVSNIPVESLRNNVALVAGGSKIFKVPVIVTTVAEKSFSGPVFPELLEVYPQASSGYIDRTTMNAWEDVNAFKAITGKGKKKIVIAGLWTSVCIVGPVLSAITDGYDVYVITDACGDVSKESHDMAIHRMMQAGAKMMTSTQYVLELQRDWARAETYQAVTDLFVKYGGAYGIGIQYSRAMLKH